MRHGEPGPEGLTEYGKEQAKTFGRNIEKDNETFYKIQSSPIKRTQQTREGIIEELAKKDVELGVPRDKKILSYESLHTKANYDWQQFLKNNLPDDFDKLSEEGKRQAKQRAETLAVNEMFKNPIFTRESASHVAYLIDKYLRMAKRLDSNSKVRIENATHNNFLSAFAKEVLWQKDKDGEYKLGIQDINEIGGSFLPTESFEIILSTDENGKATLSFKFGNPERLKNIEYGIDLEKIKLLTQEYSKGEKTLKV